MSFVQSDELNECIVSPEQNKESWKSMQMDEKEWKGLEILAELLLSSMNTRNLSLLEEGGVGSLEPLVAEGGEGSDALLLILQGRLCGYLGEHHGHHLPQVHLGHVCNGRTGKRRNS